MMSKRELERLLDLLAKWHETHPEDGAMRDDVSHLRNAIDEEIESRG